MGPLSIGDEAPNFDLTSTEDALLMLRDEVIQSAIVLYFFADLTSDRTRRDLEALNKNLDALGRLRARVLAVSPAKLDDFEDLMRQYGIVDMQRTGRVALPKLERQARLRSVAGKSA